jgi:fluoroacetyl-CoA thioesterase
MGRRRASGVASPLTNEDAMTRLAAGLKGSLTWEVTEDLCMKRGVVPVFSTPSMVLLVERAAIHAIEPCLSADQRTLGTSVELRHLAPSFPGQRVRAEVELLEVDRRRLSFRVEVFDEVEKVGEGTHERFIVDPAKYDVRVRAKLDALKR